MSAETVGFVGIGNMGAPMSRNVAKAGHDVILFDIDHARAAALAGTGPMAAAESPAGLAAANFLVTMLPDGASVREALLGENAIVPHLARDSLIVDMSSSDPVGTRALGGELAGRGMAFIDAPVSGAVPRAEAGTLTIMAGSDDPALIERARPVLAAMGQDIMPTGRLGSGHAMKALNNYVAAAGFAAVCEAMIVGQRFGLDPATMVEIMNVSTGRNFMTDLVMKPHVIDGAFATGFAAALLAKDVGIAETLATDLGIDARLLSETARLWREARDHLPPGADNTEAFKAWQARMVGKGTDR